MGQSFTKGQIINVNLGNPPEEVKGHEQGLERPCVIIKSFDNLNLAVVVPLTTKEPKYSLFTTVKIIKKTAGLTADSYALCHQIRTISFDRIVGKRGKLPDIDVLKVQAVLIDILEL
ncbi:type II toxin-antitoxin system PemK/MazF family toxin [Fibrella sp. HMF5335]|uniref:Type II toxin-antitoxin system PemK/MazF family toxin n=1 Tax=Fibrella rubiginis TaxID=2817060 RepID=A0A939JZI4_9BACT|nr:type II toxin-antitoxin system PemK/MazF family toxin [Fibrella rubiginis]MBO0935092.1 type II toxin-antitoxin system PemK/MazF family toxin [Fibrella rubiginis]